MYQQSTASVPTSTGVLNPGFWNCQMTRFPWAPVFFWNPSSSPYRWLKGWMLSRFSHLLLLLLNSLAALYLPRAKIVVIGLIITVIRGVYRTSRWTSTFASTGTTRDSTSPDPATRMNSASATRCSVASGGPTRSSPMPRWPAFTQRPRTMPFCASVRMETSHRVCGISTVWRRCSSSKL